MPNSTLDIDTVNLQEIVSVFILGKKLCSELAEVDDDIFITNVDSGPKRKGSYNISL